MPNVLYIGPYKENNGHGRYSRRLLNCLRSDTNIGLKSIPIYLTQNIKFNDAEKHITNFEQVEQSSYDEYDYIIQHGDPMMFQYHRKYGKNIGVVDIETIGIKHTGYVERINMMDEVIVNSMFSFRILEESGVTIPIKIVPQPYNIDTNKIPANFFTYLEKPYVFYTIGQHYEKNNILSIVLAFLLEFDDEENVKLFIKTGNYLQDNNTTQDALIQEINKIVSTLRHKRISSSKIDILCGTLSDEDILKLHDSSDCYVNCVKTDSFGPSAIEAGLFGKEIINTKYIGSNSYISSNNGILVDAAITQVCSSVSYYKNSYTIFEQWYDPDIYSIKNAMREAYNKQRSYKNNFKEIFSYKNVLQQLSLT